MSSPRVESCPFEDAAVNNDLKACIASIAEMDVKVVSGILIKTRQ